MNSMEQTAAEHLAWCKERARAAFARGDTPREVLDGMTSDLNKHEGTRSHGGIRLGAILKASGLLETERQVREWVEGFFV